MFRILFIFGKKIGFGGKNCKKEAIPKKEAIDKKKTLIQNQSYLFFRHQEKEKGNPRFKMVQLERKQSRKNKNYFFFEILI